MRTVAGWCVRHRRIVLAGWVAILIAIVALSQGVGSAYKDSFTLNGTQSFQAQSLLQRSAPKAAGDREQIVFAVGHGHVTDPAIRARVQTVLAKVAALPGVTQVASPFGVRGAAQISASRQIAFADVSFGKPAPQISSREGTKFVSTARAGASHGLQVEIEGQVAGNATQPKSTGTAIGALAALIVLLVVFGSLLAAALPLMTAGVALGVGTAVVALLSHVIDIASFSTQLSLLIGLGVGVDYALFIVTRFRQGLERGKPVEEAIVDAIDTSGRAVMFAGITVCIALLGMFALGVSFLYGVAVAASIVVLFTVFTALTLLPAMLGFFGTRVLGRRRRRRLQAGGLEPAHENGLWARWSDFLQARPAMIATAAALLMIALALPFASMRLGSSDSGSDPAGSTTRQAYDLLAKGFGPGYNGPLMLVAQVNGASQAHAFAEVADAVAHTKDVVRVTQPVVMPARPGQPGVVMAQAYPVGSPQAASTADLLDKLRGVVVPKAGSGVHVLVGGQTAIFADFSSVLSAKLPQFIGVVVLLSFLLLTAVFRSLAVPATAAVMNMISAGAAFGVVTAVFQFGWLASVIGVDRTGPIMAFLPVLMFAILFGLSMDYEVFLVTRIFEEWHRTGDNRAAVSRGLAATGGTINAAATIMILIFASFILGGDLIIKMFGVGLASAVILDALIVRSVLVPGVMLLIGKANWYLPAALDRLLPRLNVEGSATEHPSSHPDDVDRELVEVVSSV